ncbi:hypothetical protein SAMN02745196_01557 [Clostridium collagenovorans DSM 3089]|uniref:Uncharacterized protein n=1 Tax=Clostridium collagenovorans DSM 3089 TaxID=1121306 RepID=A0A1M5W556_9CLOT|nr:hypothetical protein [Clostridium collagenovorans]SHH82605.1 hypothetical protein SAMN02745196_01557 [Clostridium collagenovorans DSM 3089]
MEDNYRNEKRDNSQIEAEKKTIPLSQSTEEKRNKKRKRNKKILVESVIIGLKIIIGILILNIVVKVWNLGFNIDGLNFFI